MKLCRTGCTSSYWLSAESRRKRPQKVNIRTVKLIQIRDCSSSEIDNVAIQRVIYQSQQITENNSDARSRTKRSEIAVSMILSSHFFFLQFIVNRLFFVSGQISSTYAFKDILRKKNCNYHPNRITYYQSFPTLASSAQARCTKVRLTLAPNESHLRLSFSA